jgi:hypothetical protein
MSKRFPVIHSILSPAALADIIFSSLQPSFHLDLDHFIEKPLRLIGTFLIHRQDLWVELKRITGRIHRGILSLLESKLEWGFCQWCTRLNHTEPVWWPPFLRGYQDIRPLGDADRQAIPFFVGCRFIWQMGVHCENAAESVPDAV